MTRALDEKKACSSRRDPVDTRRFRDDQHSPYLNAIKAMAAEKSLAACGTRRAAEGLLSRNRLGRLDMSRGIVVCDKPLKDAKRHS